MRVEEFPPSIRWNTLRNMSIDVDKRRLAEVTAAAATIAAMAKLFLPFHLIGSTAIFALASAIAAMLIIIRRRPLYEMAGKVGDFLIGAGVFYVLVTVNFLLLSRPIVPATHLIGILAFHGLFLIFGFATARSLNVLLVILLAAAAIYLIAIARYAVMFGDLEQDGYLHDIFGFGEPAVFVTFHQNMGFMFGLAVIALFGLVSNRIGAIFFLGVLPAVLLFLFYISARGALVAILCSLIFWLGAELWLRSRKLTLAGIAVIALVTAFTSGFFYRYALHDKSVDAKAPDAISRTIREIQDPRPGFRLQILARAWHRIATEPDKLLFGRGIGIYPVDEGFGAPDWLLRPTEGSKHYPHNVHLEMLYETGIIGLLLFSFLTFMPVVWSVHRWSLLSKGQKACVALYVFTLVSSDISGAFAYTYVLQFFLGLTVGITALERIAEANQSGGTIASSKAEYRVIGAEI
jgi:O-antigen ligase